MTVNKSTPELSVSAYQPGKSVTVSVSAFNPYNAALTDIPTPTVICRIGNGTAQTVAGNTFTIPEGTENGAVITFTVSTAENGYYQAAERSTILTVSGISDETIYHVLKTSGSDLGGTVTIQPESARPGGTVAVTAAPRSGYTLKTVTARDAGAAVPLTSLGSGRYTFVMPGSNVTLDAVFDATQSDWVNPFSDIVEGAWYYKAVKFVSRNGLMNGSGGVFDHSGDLSRRNDRADPVQQGRKACGNARPGVQRCGRRAMVYGRSQVGGAKQPCFRKRERFIFTRKLHYTGAACDDTLTKH